MGALIGAGALALAVPIVRPLVLTFGSPELFMLSLVGISCITSLSGTTTRGQIKGFAMGLFGLLISTIGQERQSGSLRFDLGMMYLWDGLDFVPVLVGIFRLAVVTSSRQVPNHVKRCEDEINHPLPKRRFVEVKGIYH